jgi:hypothetical protein
MNPFELRAELLKTAEEYLKQQHELNTEFAKRTFDALVAQGEKVQADWQQYMPKMYTLEEVVENAKKLYGFVNAK